MGGCLPPRRGMALDGKLPETIPLADLPMTPKFGRNNPLPAGALNLFPDNPKILKEFHVQDAYLIKTEGDYSLVVWPSIYQFSTNRQFVNRLDLMPLSMKLHLWPSQ